MNNNFKIFIGSLKNNLWLHLTILFLLFTALYFPHTLIMNENVETIAAFEIDASLMIDSVFQHLKTYNLQLGYMSRFYGWSYFFINYVLLKPIDIIANILDYSFSISFNIFLVKIIYFSISLASLLSIYWLFLKIFKNKFISLIASLFYLFPALKFALFVDIKPETTGLLFLFVSQICLINFIEDKANRMLKWYLFGLLSMSMSFLAKQSFVFLFFPAILIYYFYYVKKNKFSFWKHLKSKQILLIIFYSIIFGSLVALVVYPHMFLHPNNFINSQVVLLKDHGSSGALVLKGKDLFYAWANAIWSNLFLKLVLLMWPVSLLISILDKKNKLRAFFIILITSVPPIAFVLTKNSGLFINVNYLSPLIPMFIFIILLPFSKALQAKNSFLKIFLSVFFLYLLTSNIIYNFFQTSSDLNKRLAYKDSEVMKLSEYIATNIPVGSKLAVSEGVLIPKNGSQNIYSFCHWWNNCALMSQLEEFNPNYLIFVENTIYNGIRPSNYLNFIEYLEKNNFRRVADIGQFVVYQEI